MSALTPAMVIVFGIGLLQPVWPAAPLAKPPGSGHRSHCKDSIPGRLGFSQKPVGEPSTQLPRKVRVQRGLLCAGCAATAPSGPCAPMHTAPRVRSDRHAHERGGRPRATGAAPLVTRLPRKDKSVQMHNHGDLAQISPPGLLKGMALFALNGTY